MKRSREINLFGTHILESLIGREEGGSLQWSLLFYGQRVNSLILLAVLFWYSISLSFEYKKLNFACFVIPSLVVIVFHFSSCVDLEHLHGLQAEILGRAEGIKKEYNELDTVWFMAGSLFQVTLFILFGKSRQHYLLLFISH